MKLQLSPLSLALALIHASISHADVVDTTYSTRITGQMLAGNYQQLGGFGDAMLPFMQQQDRRCAPWKAERRGA
ncbi:MAG: hypothetical protein P4L65_10175 [Legionella sp.]|nr:hypothetical protein [Legionella sp.]